MILSSFILISTSRRDGNNENSPDSHGKKIADEKNKNMFPDGGVKHKNVTFEMAI